MTDTYFCHLLLCTSPHQIAPRLANCVHCVKEGRELRKPIRDLFDAGIAHIHWWVPPVHVQVMYIMFWLCEKYDCCTQQVSLLECVVLSIFILNNLYMSLLLYIDSHVVCTLAYIVHFLYSDKVCCTVAYTGCALTYPLLYTHTHTCSLCPYHTRTHIQCWRCSAPLFMRGRVRRRRVRDSPNSGPTWTSS